MRLQRHVGNAAPRECRDGVGHAGFLRRYHIGAGLSVYITTLDPDGPPVAIELMHEREERLRVCCRHDEGARERQSRGRHARHQTMTVTVEHTLRRIDRERLGRHEIQQPLRGRGTLTHVDVQLRGRKATCGYVGFVGTRHRPSGLLEHRDGVVKNRRVIASVRRRRIRGIAVQRDEPLHRGAFAAASHDSAATRSRL